MIELAQELVPAEGSVNIETILSTSLKAALQGPRDVGSSRLVLLPDSEMSAIQSVAIAHMKSLRHAYHNDVHVVGVVQVVRALADDAKLNPIERQLLELAALFHDYGHAGNSYRQLVPNAPQNHRSNEEFAALHADEILGTRLSVPQRVALQGLILATSFAQSSLERIPEAIREEAYRRYGPVTKLEKMLAFADVASGLSSFDSFDKDNANLIREGGPALAPASFEAYLNGRLGFLNYLQIKLEEVKEFLSPDLVARYGLQIAAYRTRIENYLVDRDSAESTDMYRALQEVRPS